jgi:hypothetical protein
MRLGRGCDGELSSLPQAASETVAAEMNNGRLAEEYSIGETSQQLNHAAYDEEYVDRSARRSTLPLWHSCA